MCEWVENAFVGFSSICQKMNGPKQLLSYPSYLSPYLKYFQKLFPGIIRKSNIPYLFPASR